MFVDFPMCTNVRESEYFKCTKPETFMNTEKPPLEWTSHGNLAFKVNIYSLTPAQPAKDARK